MNAHDRLILSLVSGPGQFITPKFQRPFRWNDEQCLTLLDDIAEASESVAGERHFLGSIVHFPRVTEFGFSKSLLIDGQQRLTTLTLILRDADQEALQYIVDHGSPRDGDTGSVARRYRALLEATLSREPEKILRRLDHTCHVNVVLGPQDNNQDIFESLLTPSQESSFQAWW